MNILIPISYFSGLPRSEIWKINVKTDRKYCIYTLPISSHAVLGKGITGLAWLNKQTLVACDFNRVLLIQRNKIQITQVTIDQQFNDLHSIFVNEDFIFVTNTGRDSIDILDHKLNLINRIDTIPDLELKKRIKGEYTTSGRYYNSPSLTIPFYKRKVPDKWHFNHLTTNTTSLQGTILLTSLKTHQLVDANTLTPLNKPLPMPPHDGFIYNNAIWVTTVSGQIYRASLSLQKINHLSFELFFDLFLHVAHKGWCRGLHIIENCMYIGITVIKEMNDRTKWLNVSPKSTRTGVYRLCLNSMSILKFYDFSHESGSRIFTLLEDT